MTAQTRNYTRTDHGVCKYAFENRALDGTLNGLRTSIADSAQNFTVERVQRMRRLNLIDGDELATTDGEFVKLTGLGFKTAEEAIRLGVQDLRNVQVTFSNANNNVNATSHGFVTGDQVTFSGSGTLPAEVNRTTEYWVRNEDANAFQISVTQTGPVVDFTDNGSGDRYANLVP